MSSWSRASSAIDAMDAPDHRQFSPGGDDRRNRHDRTFRPLARYPQPGRSRRCPADDRRKVERLGDLTRRRRDRIGAGRLRLGVQQVQRRQIDRHRSPPARRSGSWSPPLRPGYWPAADSADSIIASAPSKIAVATSETSARVGTGLAIIDSSIWVATTTGLPARRQARVMSFCTPGTFSSGISTPRSPRATISASARSRISARRATACGFSIFAITAARPRVIFLASAMSSGRWMNDSATQSMPASSAASRSAISFGASAASGTTVSGRLTPLRFDILPPTSTRATMRCGSTSVADQTQLAVVDQKRVAGLDRGEDFRMRQLHAPGVARRRDRYRR